MTLVNNNKLLVILGPTSTGKTDLAIQLSKKFNGELVSADSRQIYKNLDIGTGKMPNKFNDLKKEKGKWTVDGIQILLYDLILPQKQYTVADYFKDANRVIWEINKKHKLPIIVGGTGLYIKALIEGLPTLSIPTSKKIRKRLEKLSIKDLQTRLLHISEERFNKMNNSDRQNPRRLIRAIELEINKDKKRVEGVEGLAKRFNILKIGLTAEKGILYQRSDERVLRRIKQGMIKEAQNLKRTGLSLKRMRELGLEYGVLADYLEEKKTEAELIKTLQFKIHGYIRRQLTWFRKEKNVFWYDITTKDFFNRVEKKISEWYH